MKEFLREFLGEMMLIAFIAFVLIGVVVAGVDDTIHTRRVSVACAKVGGVVVQMANGTQFCAKVEPLVWDGR